MYVCVYIYICILSTFIFHRCTLFSNCYIDICKFNVCVHYIYIYIYMYAGYNHFRNCCICVCKTNKVGFITLQKECAIPDDSVCVYVYIYIHIYIRVCVYQQTLASSVFNSYHSVSASFSDLWAFQARLFVQIVVIWVSQLKSAHLYACMCVCTCVCVCVHVCMYVFM